LQNGGAAVTKYAVNAILSDLLPPGVMSLAGPVIDTMIENRIDLIAALVGAAKNHDAARAGQVINEAVLIFQIDGTCALLTALPGVPDSFVQATCGTLGKIIGAAGKSIYNGIQYVESLLKDPLNAPDKFYTDLSKEINDLRHTLAGKDDDCS